MDDEPTPPATSEPTPIPPSDRVGGTPPARSALGVVVFVAALVVLIGLTGIIGRSRRRPRRPRPSAPAPAPTPTASARAAVPPHPPPPRRPLHPPPGAHRRRLRRVDARPHPVRSVTRCSSARAISRTAARWRRGDRAAARRHRGYGLHGRRQRLRPRFDRRLRRLLRPDLGSPQGPDLAGGRQPRLEDPWPGGLPRVLRRGSRRPDGTSWYAKDLGTWRVIVLDSTASKVGGCDAGLRPESLARETRHAPGRLHARACSTIHASAPVTSTATTRTWTRSGGRSTRPVST